MHSLKTLVHFSPTCFCFFYILEKAGRLFFVLSLKCQINKTLAAVLCPETSVKTTAAIFTPALFGPL